MTSPFTKFSHNEIGWDHRPGDTYAATGVTRSGKRFKTVGSWEYIRAINVCKGSKWLIRDGRKYRIQSINN